MKDTEDLLSALEVFLDCAGGVSFWKFDSHGLLEQTNSENPELFSALFHLGVEEKIRSQASQDGKPILVSDPLSLVWLVVPRRVDKILTDLYAIGPILTAPVREQVFLNRILTFDSFPVLKQNPLEQMKKVPIISLVLMLQYGQFLYRAVYRENITVHDIRMITDELAPAEQAEYKHSLDEERIRKEIFRAVEEGNIDYTHPQAIMSVPLASLSEEGPLRQAKNLAIVAISRITDAALRGGLPITSAYALSDQYIRHSESCKSVLAVYQNIRNAFTEFTLRVHAIRSRGYSAPVEEVISYIRNHRSEPLLMEKLAAEIGYSKNHLAVKFKQETGFSPTQYALNYKLKLAERELRRDDKSIQTICQDLGFEYPSYFTKVFRDRYGCSPTAYRANPSLWLKESELL